MRESHHIIARRVGLRLKELRGSMTQTEFAAELGIGQATYNRYETGKRLAPDWVLQEVGERCGLSPAEVAFGSLGSVVDEAELVQEVARLAALLDGQGLEDLYLYLEAKVEALLAQRKKQNRAIRGALTRLRRRVDKAG